MAIEKFNINLDLNLGDKFTSFQDADAEIARVTCKNFVQYYRRDSRTIEAAKKKTKRYLNPHLQYYQIKYTCIHGGRKHIPGGKGLRNRKTFRNENICPANIVLRVSDSGHELEVIKIENDHNHRVDQILFNELPHQRKLRTEIHKNTKKLLKIKKNKHMLRDQLEQETHKVIQLKDLTNLQQKKNDEYQNSIAVKKYGRGLLFATPGMISTMNAYPEMVKNELDLSTKCRSCFSEVQDMHNLFGEFDQGMSLSDILRSTTSFEVVENDGLSPYLCENCTNVIIDFFNFKSIYQENEKYLRSLFNEQNSKNIVAVADTEDDIKLEEQDTNTCLSESDDCSVVGDIINTEFVEYGDTIIEVYDEDSFTSNIEENRKFDLTKRFVAPQEILEDQVIHDVNITEYLEKVDAISIKYSCDKCGDCFLVKSGFQQHMLQEHKVRVNKFEKYTCKVPTLSNLEIKNCETHKKYVCEYCGAAFIKKSYLDDHSEVHKAEKRHICPICGKAFRQRTVLRRHKKLHTHPRQCVCEMCGLRFNDKGTLNTHIKLKHTKERNFNCIICGLWFPLKSTLEKHIFRHNENRNREFLCTKCDMAYKDKSSLNRHIIIKHTDNAKKPSCTYCGKQYTTNTNLLKHIQKHHVSLPIKKESDSD